jgi:heme exporter protein CcmD
MNWHSLAAFAEMGGYALYVWGAYAMLAAALAWEALMLAQRRRSAIEALRDHEAHARAEARHATGP